MKRGILFVPNTVGEFNICIITWQKSGKAYIAFVISVAMSYFTHACYYQYNYMTSHKASKYLILISYCQIFKMPVYCINLQVKL